MVEDADRMHILIIIGCQVKGPIVLTMCLNPSVNRVTGQHDGRLNLSYTVDSVITESATVTHNKLTTGQLYRVERADDVIGQNDVTY